jgi:hypothetical protein
MGEMFERDKKDVPDFNTDFNTDNVVREWQ